METTSNPSQQTRLNSPEQDLMAQVVGLTLEQEAELAEATAAQRTAAQQPAAPSRVTLESAIGRIQVDVQPGGEADFFRNVLGDPSVRAALGTSSNTRVFAGGSPVDINSAPSEGVVYMVVTSNAERA